jgi:integrase
MSKPRTGTFEIAKVAGKPVYRGRLRLADGTKSDRFDVDVRGEGLNEAQARAKLASLQVDEDTRHLLFNRKRDRARERAQARGEAVEGETCSAYRSRLDAHRKELGRRTGTNDRSAWKVWIADRIGHLPIAKVTRDDIEGVRDALDEAIIAHKRSQGKDGTSPKRALNVWSVLVTTFKAACMAKRKDLRVRTDNPCVGVLPPERGESRRRTFIYPNETLTLLSCGKVPIEDRELYAIACYLYLRPGELRALLWTDVDLGAGVVHVTKSYDEASETVGPPKTRNGIRDVPIHPNLVPLLKRMRRPDGPVVPVMAIHAHDERATTLRSHLGLAKVTRPRLIEDTLTTMPVGFRSWRDTGITWLALAGVDLPKMQRRAGHDNIGTTVGYVKAAEDVSGSIGEPFPPLPACLVSPPTGGGKKLGQRLGQTPHFRGGKSKLLAGSASDSSRIFEALSAVTDSSPEGATTQTRAGFRAREAT